MVRDDRAFQLHLPAVERPQAEVTGPGVALGQCTRDFARRFRAVVGREQIGHGDFTDCVGVR